MYVGLHVQHPLFLLDFRKKSLNVKFHENPSSGRGVVPCERTDGQMRKLTVAIRNSANAPKNIHRTNNAQTHQHATTCTPPSSQYLYHLSTAVPLPPTNTTPIYVFCMTLTMYTLPMRLSQAGLSDGPNCFPCGKNWTATRSAEQRGASQYRASNHKNISPLPL